MVKDSSDFHAFLDLQNNLKKQDELINKLTRLDNLIGLPNWATTNTYLENCFSGKKLPVGLL